MPFACHPNGIMGRGLEQTDVMIVGVSPAREEMRSGKVYSGQTGKLLESVLKAVEPKFEECYATNLLCYWNREPTIDDVEACAPRLREEIAAIKPKVIVALGELAIQFFTKLKKTGAARGSCLWSDEFNCWIISTWQPTVALTVSPVFISDIVRDLTKINYIKDKPFDFGKVNYEVVHSPVQAQQILDSDWIRTAQFVSNDVD